MTDKLSLTAFFPNRLARLQGAVCGVVAQIYAGQFNLTRQQWQIMAALGDQCPKSAKTICALTELDKMQTSRAIAKLVKQGIIVKVTDKKDKRSALLSLTDKGHHVYQQIEPLILNREQQLLRALSPSEQQQFFSMMDKLQRKSLEF